MKNMLTRFLRVSFEAVLIGAVLAACVGSPPPASASTDGLDAAIREASTYLNGRLPEGSKVAFLNIRSDYPDLSEYILSVLSENAVNDGIFAVVDRRELDAIREEQNFQMSGEVSDESAQSIGQMLGAQSIVSGAVSKIGALYRVQIKAIEVQTAAVQGQWSRSVPGGPIIAALTERYAPAQAGTVIISAPASGPRPAGSPAAAPAAYKIGDTGPAGGLIFYDKGNNSGGWRYLEAAPVDIPQKLYATEEGVGIASQRAVGTGKINTQAIMIQANNRGGGFGWAAQACDALEVNGFDDWFLPSRDELHYMYGNLHMRNLGGFSLDWYWTSTYSHYDNSSIGINQHLWWAENFSDGRQAYDVGNRDTNYTPYLAGSPARQLRIRACRQF